MLGKTPDAGETGHAFTGGCRTAGADEADGDREMGHAFTGGCRNV